MLHTLYQSTLTSLPLLVRGKVRDVYAVGDEHLLIVTTDRLSAFDVILPDPIPGKGVVLTAVSNFWFERTRGIIPNHLSGLSLADVLPDAEERAQVEGRAIVVRKLKALPVEAIVRGYLIGSGWKDYQRCGRVCGIPLLAGLRLADKLPAPIFTPSTKADAGVHDENIDFDRACAILGSRLAEQVRDASLAIYTSCAGYALKRGIIIADTKFEFGLDADNRLVLIDEILTLGTRPNQGKIAFEYVPEVGQFIQAIFSHQVSDRGDAGIIVGGELRPVFFSVGVHRPEFYQMKGLAFQPYPLLTVKYRTGG